jgi:hypothetical protein
MGFLADAAPYAFDLGWPVFPQARASVRKAPLVERGCYAASTSDQQLAAWDEQFGEANVGLATGAASGVVVIDLDGEEGIANWAALEGKVMFRLPETVVSETGGGGRHLFFRSPGQCKNSVSRIAPKIDVRGDGGAAALPPSLHHSGRTYRWVVSPWDRPLAMFPLALLRFVKEPIDYGRRAMDWRQPAGDVGKQLAGIVRVASQAPNGERNHTLNWAAYTAAGLIGSGMAESQVRAALMEAAAACGLDRIEATGTINSGLRAGKSKGGQRARPQPDRSVGDQT